VLARGLASTLDVKMTGCGVVWGLCASGSNQQGIVAWFGGSCGRNFLNVEALLVSNLKLALMAQVKITQGHLTIGYCLLHQFRLHRPPVASCSYWMEVKEHQLVSW